MRLLASLMSAVVGLWASKVVAQQQQPDRISVTGPQGGFDAHTGAPPARININDMWAQGGPSWDLYILALLELQDVDEADDLSYFQIMGAEPIPLNATARELVWIVDWA
ncbi:hypothetical protein INS49_008910 [Diaporthe citri]|uniref:uncharacterized protein n=1 Tax=Diaporthe citri TaxID=83186 RepID=UPI001C7EBDBC|nr:uncharacterized protein INS49_008910 [Diaporthe citri]KAG6363807.1 hypothetical protein INS49_008910 [Diaporthe citri]